MYLLGIIIILQEALSGNNKNTKTLFYIAIF